MLNKEKIVALGKSNAFISFSYLLLGLIFFRAVFLHSNWIVFGTDGLDHFSITNYLRQMIHEHGQYPLWIPVHYGGMPHFDATLAVNVNLFALFYYIFPLTTAFNLFMLVHFFFAGLFTFIFSLYLGYSRISSFIAGLIFMFSGVLVSHLFVGHIPKIGTWAYLPLLLFLIGKGIDTKGLKYFLVAGLVMGHQFLGYHMQMAYYSTLFVGAFALFKIINNKKSKDSYGEWLVRPGGYFILSITIAVLLYSIQLIPSYLYTHKYSERSGGTTYEFSTSWSFAPVELPGIVVRDPFGYAWPWTANMAKRERNKDTFSKPFVPYWGPMPQRLTGDYFGVLPFILAIIGLTFARTRYSWFFMISALVTLLLSMGKYTPLYWLAYKFVYGFSFFRVPSSIFALTVFALSLLAGKGMDFLLTDDNRYKEKGVKRFVWGLSVFTVLLLVFSGLTALFGESYPDFFKVDMDKYRFAAQLASYDSMVMDRFIKIRNGLFILSAFSVISTVAIYFRSIGKLRKDYFSILLLLVIIIDLWGYGKEFVKYSQIDENTFYGNKESVQLIKEDNKKNIFRVLAIDDRSIQNASINLRSFAYHGIELINGRHDLAPIYYQQMLNASLKNLKLLNLLNTKYVLVTQNNDLRRFVGNSESAARQFNLLLTDDTFKLYKNKGYMNRAFIVNRARIVNNEKYVLPYMMRDQFNPAVEVVIEEKPVKPDGIAGEPAKENKLEIELYSPNRVTVNAELKSEGFLVLADTYYPDWKVYVDGVEGKIYRADSALRGVYLTAGRHKVEFVYNSRILNICGLIAGLTLILSLSAIGWIYYREKNGLPTP